MAKRAPSMRDIALRGLEIAPSQVRGAIRLVPLLRNVIKEDLRFTQRNYREASAIVSIDGEPMAAGVKYIGYVPHGLVVSWSDDGAPVAAYGAQMSRPDGKVLGRGRCAVRIAHRMVKREEGNRLRMLPLHIAMEGFLSLCFNGPEVAWSEYSKYAISTGLSPRFERVAPGHAIPGLEGALRVFEIHERQVGVLVFVADALASAFVVSHPDDYRALHKSIVEDFFGELMIHYGMLPPTGHLSTLGMDASRVKSTDDLLAELERMRAEWATFHGFMADGLLGRPITSKPVYKAGPFALQRFMTDLRPSEENHIGEAIVREDGELEYLKTYRLSAAQTRRAYLLLQLAKHHWNLDATAAGMASTREQLIQRLSAAGFGYLLKEHVLKAARA